MAAVEATVAVAIHSGATDGKVTTVGLAIAIAVLHRALNNLATIDPAVAIAVDGHSTGSDVAGVNHAVTVAVNSWGDSEAVNFTFAATPPAPPSNLRIEF